MVEVMMMWQSMSAWLTPTVLFFVTNFIIASIFIASNKHHHQHSDHSHSVASVSSFLHRVKSIKLSSSSEESQHQSHHHHHHHPPPPVQLTTPNYTSTSRLAQSIFKSSDHVTAVTTPPELPSPSQLDPVVEPGELVRVPSFFDRVKSFNISSAMEKSRSEVRIGGEDDVDLRRPETARESSRNDDVDEEVDAKADDFISRFKQQLKLQRLESLVRYNEMLNRRR
ncbi:uncharacterized protein LOC143579348 [Bidens hawaiensis]|uniref:uncharacterized protein LOC143579348 n=1 Tax=Bidens hawaiensis TaxID=980011 RepID=UPI00404A2379